MKEKIIEIGQWVEDTYFDHPQQTMASIIDALHKNDRVILHLTEGVALEELNYKEKNFLKILKEVCVENNWPMNKIHFVLPNLIQDRKVWPSIEYGGSSTADSDIKNNLFLHSQGVDPNIKKNFKHTFGHFVVRSTWDRLMIGSHLNTNHLDKTFQTYCKSLDDPAHMLHMDLDMMLHMASCSNKVNTKMLNEIMQFIGKMPIEKTKNKPISERKPDEVFGWVEGPVDSEILDWYNEIFIDVVCEKMITGQTFFPTEKTARPLATKTPFLIMAAPNYITNLRKLGFRSFGQFWNEEYDYQQGVQRVESIKCIIDNLGQLDSKQLQIIHEQMTPILEHNYKTYTELTPKKILSFFKI